MIFIDQTQTIMINMSLKEQIGTLITYGQIQLERYYRSREKEIFLYDHKTCFHENVLEENTYYFE